MDVDEKLALLFCISTLALTLLFDYPMYQPMRREDYSAVHLATYAAGNAVVLAITALIFAYLISTYRILTDEQKVIFRDIVTFFGLGLAGAVATSVRLVDLIVLGGTDASVSVFGRSIYIDPVSFSAAVCLISYGVYFYLLWVMKESGTYSRPRSLLALPLYVVTAVLAVHPLNNYSNVVEYVTPVKVVARVLLFAAAAVPSVLAMRSKAGEVGRKGGERALLFVTSNALMLLSLVFWVVDGLVEQTYSPYILAFFVLFMLGFIGVALSILWPGWVARLMRRVHTLLYPNRAEKTA